MLDPGDFHQIVSGRRRGLSAAAWRAGLRAAEVPYKLAVRWRNRRYDRGHAATMHVEVPVVSVGNLTLGGTGKTPLVEWLARWFRTRGVRVSIVSRGYGAAAGPNDEALELEQKLPDVPHLQNADRVAAARVAIDELATQLVVLDDGFQHRRLARDLDIVLLDALAPWGHDHVFPRGLLREPVESLGRADVVILSRSDAVAPAAVDEVRVRAAALAPRALWLAAAHRPRELLSASGHRTPCESLAGQRVAAFCGIGNPAGFEHTLRQAGLEVVACRTFPDHHAYTRRDIEELAAWVTANGAAALVCTHKDLVKLGVERLGDRPLWALAIELVLVGQVPELERRLDDLARQALDAAS